MKHPVPVVLLIIPAGLLIIALVVIFARFYSSALSGALFLETKQGGPSILVYTGLVLFPVIAGALMALAITILTKWEDRKFERLLKAGRKDQRILYRDFSRSLEIIEASIQKIRRSSEILKRQTEALQKLGGQLRENPLGEVTVEQSETRSVTLEDNVITDVQVIQPVDALIRQGLSPLLRPRQRLWFFPRK
jgi:hypothetical protein